MPAMGVERKLEPGACYHPAAFEVKEGQGWDAAHILQPCAIRDLIAVPKVERGEGGKAEPQLSNPRVCDIAATCQVEGGEVAQVTQPLDPRISDVLAQ